MSEMEGINFVAWKAMREDRDYFKAAYERKLADEAKALDAAQAAVAESERLKHLAIHWERRAIANGAKAEQLADALESVLACNVCGDDYGQCTACRKRMTAALRLAGRLP